MIYLAALVYLWPVCTCKHKLQPEAAAFSLFLGWLNLLLYFRRYATTKIENQHVTVSTLMLKIYHIQLIPEAPHICSGGGNSIGVPQGYIVSKYSLSRRDLSAQWLRPEYTRTNYVEFVAFVSGFLKAFTLVLMNPEYILRIRKENESEVESNKFVSGYEYTFLVCWAAVTLELKKRAKQTKSVYIVRTAVTWKLFSFHVTAVRACLFV